MDTTSATTARWESVSGFPDEDGEQELRSSGVTDFVRDRSSSVDLVTGCSSISIGDVYFTEVPPAAGLPAGKRWVKSSGGGVAEIEAEFEETLKPQVEADGSTSSTMIMFVVPDPPLHEYLPYLRTHGELKRIDEEDVRGVPTTRYRTTFDRNEWTRSQLEQAGWKAENIDKYLEGHREPDQEVEVWVDANQRIRRVVTRSSSSVPPMGVQISDSTTEYFDFGAELDIAAPPAAEVLGAGEWEPVGDTTNDDHDTGDDATGQDSGDATAPNCK